MEWQYNLPASVNPELIFNLKTIGLSRHKQCQLVVPVAWQEGNHQARDVLEVIQTLPKLLGFQVKTIVGLSNLTSGGPTLEGRLRLEAAYLPMLAAAGVTHVLLNVFHPQTLKLAAACCMLLEPRVFAWGAVD